MTTSIKKIAFISGVLFALIGVLQVSAVTLGDVAPVGEATQCIDLKYNLIITARDEATNGEVTLLQEFLQQNGFLAADPTGYFGAQTKAAVMKFQKSVDLIDSGYVATYTRAAIKKATCGTTLSGAVSSTKVCAYEGTVFGGSAPCTAAIEGSTANGSKCSCTLAPVIPAASTGSGAKVCAYEGAVFGGSPTCTEAIEGQNNGSRCTCKAATTNSTSASTATTQSTSATTGQGSSPSTIPPNFPYTFINETTATGNVLSRLKLTLKGTPLKSVGSALKGCTKPVGSTGCTSEYEFVVVKDQPGWSYNLQTDTLSIDRNVAQEFLPNVEYVSFLRVFDGGRYEVKWKAKAATATAATTNTSTTQSSGGAVFGAGPQGVPNSQPVTYSWVVYAGSMLGQQSASNLGWSEPTTPCTASNAGATYYLGTSSSGSQVVAVCNPSNQGVTSFSTVDSSTINAGAQSTATQSTQTQSTTAQTAIPVRVPTYARGMFTNENNQQVEWACGDAGAGAPADATGWVPQGSGCFHRIVQ